MGIPFNVRRLGSTTVVGATAVTLWTSGLAQGFFFPPLPTGSGPVTVLPPLPRPNLPPVDPPEVPELPPFVPLPSQPFFPPPTPTPPLPPPDPGNPVDPQSPIPPTCACPPVPPQAVPEPATILSCIIGVGVLAAAGLKPTVRTASRTKLRAEADGRSL